MGEDTNVTPYVILLFVGFAIGAYGHAGKMRWLIGIGIVVIIVAVVLFQLEVRSGGQGRPTPPGV
jgi:mannose/fructose/N-acetylgalactosamine-specific phosphotransferase system component IIC